MNIRLLGNTNPFLTLFVNFHYFPFSIAKKLPILVSWHTVFIKARGQIAIHGPIKRGMIKIGYVNLGIQDPKFDRTKINLSGSIYFDGNALLGRGTTLSVCGQLRFGDGFVLTGSSTIICNKAIEFDSNVLLSWDCLIMDTDLHKIYNSQNEIINGDKPIFIGNNVWVGCRTTILKGSRIPSNSIVAASSVITKEFKKSNSIYGGSNGGAVLKDMVFWAH